MTLIKNQGKQKPIGGRQKTPQKKGVVKTSMFKKEKTREIKRRPNRRRETPARSTELDAQVTENHVKLKKSGTL